MVNNKFIAKIKKYFTPASLVLYGICLISGVIQLCAAVNTGFADIFNRYVSSGVRSVLAKTTNLFPFSIAETAILALPLIFAAIIIFAVKIFKRDFTESVRCLIALFGVVTLFYTLFVFGFAAAYHGSALDIKLGLERNDVTAGELAAAASALLEKAEEAADGVDFIYGSHSVMPYSLNDMNKKLNDAYEKLSTRLGFVQKLRSNVKYIMLSEPMTYTHISGVYSYYTGEANININFPDYTIPFTAAHELSHQRGIARENEANFMAYLVCMESDDPYIRYSGYINLFEYVFSSLYGADPEAYKAILQNMDNRIRYEMISYSEFFDKYRKSVASTVSNAINDTYLKIQGQTAGTKSYGLVVDMAVAYYKGGYISQ